ncbi:hypothetical protein [Halalkalibacillus halophilus]|uniref:hypothetical protein n=1 Tax=Halalkalibacillus halophilus TaxID=392827 RepID=UPI0003F75EAE|nr:hypothetical protein [Halalkalibacillus halophilus]
MLAKVLSYLLIGLLLIVAVALVFPAYLTYLWLVFGIAFVGVSGYLAFIYGKRTLLILKEERK